MPIVLTICAFYWIVMAFGIKTRNFPSTFVEVCIRVEFSTPFDTILKFSLIYLLILVI